MQKNKYYDEEYDDDYDDYEDEYDVKVYAKKNQSTNTTNNITKKAVGNSINKPNVNVNHSKQPMTQAKKPVATTSIGKNTTTTTNKYQANLINIDKPALQDLLKLNSTSSGISNTNSNATFENSTSQSKQNINNSHSHSQTSKILTIKDLNELKYPKNLPDLSLLNLENEKPNVNIVVIGHVDSGKSTLMGHLLYLMGEIDDKTLMKYEKESKRIGKNTFHFAWAMDEDTEERKRGVTVDIAYKHFQTKNKHITVMDAPGHKDFVPNMISGTSAADYALLIVDSGKNSFEAGFFHGGQTKEHAILARSLGVKKLIVCINKLEIWDWSKERFDYIQNILADYLESLDFKKKDLYFIPISGLQGINLKARSDELLALLWYEGPTLIDLIDDLENPIRDYESPLRFSISDTCQTTIGSLQGFGIFGKVESGIVYTDNEYLINPLNFKVKLRAIGGDNGKVNFLKAGMTGELLLHNDKTTTFEDIKAGNTLCCINNPVPVIKEFKAQIITLEMKTPFNIGQILIMHCLSQKGNAKLKKINKIFSRDGKVTKNNPMFVPKNYNAIVTFELEEKFCLELYSNIKQYGRITLRDQGQTLAAGVVLEFLA